MTSTNDQRRGSPMGRRVAYTTSIIVNGILMYLVNVAPGWSIVPFLTPDFATVLPWINASMMMGIASNVVYLAIDTPPVKGIGDLITQAVGLVGLVQLWRVFPFAFGTDITVWPTVARVLLAVAITGTVIGLIVTAVNAPRDPRVIVGPPRTPADR